MNLTHRPAVGRQPLKKKLAAYTAVATVAAGAANELHAGVVYDDFEDVVIVGALGGSEVASIDLDDNGTVDFQIAHEPVASTIGTALAIPCEGFTNPSATNNRFAMTQANGSYYLQNIAEDATIDDTLPNLGTGGTQTFGFLAYGSAQDCANCDFSAPTTGYIGVSFDAGGQTNYGWIRLRVDEGAFNRVTLLDSAYNDMGQAILAGQVPEPGGLGLLALGGIGLTTMRRRRSVGNGSEDKQTV